MADQLEGYTLNEGIEAMHELAKRGALPDGAKEVYSELQRRGVFDAKQAIKAEVPKAAESSAPKMSQLEATGRAVAQGATFDWADEIYGYGSNLPKLATEGYDAYKTAAAKDTAASRASNKQAAKDYPKTFLAGEVGGAIAPLALSYLLPGGQPAAVARTTSLASKVYEGAKAGGLFGSVYGAGSTESAPDASVAQAVTDTAMGAGKGAILGAGMGAALPPLFQAGSAVASKVMAPVQAYRDPNGFATRKVGEALYRDAGGEKTAGVSEMLARGGDIAKTAPNTILADIGDDATRKLMRSAVNTPNQETAAFQKMLDGRARNQAQVIEDKLITPHFGDPKEYTKTLDALLAMRNKEATPAFEKAWAGDFKASNELVDIIQSRPLLHPNGPVIKAIQANIDNARGRGYQITDLETAHLVKVELDKMIKWAANPVSQLGNSSASNISDKALRTLRNDFVDALKKSEGDGVKDYFSAIAKYGEESNIARAMELGRKVGRGETPDNIRKNFANMTQYEQDAYRRGVGYSAAQKNRDGHYHADRVRRDWDTPAMDARLQELLPPARAIAPPPPTGPQPVTSGPVVPPLPHTSKMLPPPGIKDPMMEIEAVKEALNAQRATRNAAQGNSTTAAQLKSMEDSGKEAQRVIKTMGLMKDVARGNWSAVMAKLESGAARLGGMTPEVAAQVLKILSMEGPAFKGGMSLHIDPKIMQAMTARERFDARFQRIGNQTVRGLFAGASGPTEQRR